MPNSSHRQLIIGSLGILITGLLASCSLSVDKQVPTAASSEIEGFGPMYMPNLPTVKAADLNPSELAQARKLGNVQVINERKLSDGRSITYMTIGNDVIEGGDMIVATIPELEARFAELDRQFAAGTMSLAPQAAILHVTTKWPNGIVYVDYGPLREYTSIQQTTIRNAISYMGAATDLRFVSKDSGNRIAFYKGRGCSSRNGMVNDGVVQAVYIDAVGGVQGGCIGNSTNNIAGVVHELGHVVGLIHEHQRADRGNKLVPNTSNLNATGKSQIQTTLAVSPVYHSAYDYHSVMHYQRAIPRFAINPSINVFSTPGYSGDLGPITDRELSPSDVAIINKLYP